MGVLTVIWWRDVPVNDAHVGEIARASAPFIRQVLIGASDDVSIIDAASHKVQKSVPVGHYPYGVAIDE